MLLKTFYDDSLAQASYLVGSTESHEAIVIDPAREVTPYLDAALAHGLRITQVAETHIHADFASGARELAARSGAQLFLSAMGGTDWQYGYADARTRLLHDGESWTLGALHFEALHLPGHTPEHLIFRVTDTAHADAPIGLFTGDCLFVGDVGRPDLLETAVGVVGSAEIGARQQFAAVQRLKTMDDYLQVWPGHGEGSACGKALGAVPSTTIGYEKRFNPAFQYDDQAAFVAWLLADQPETPRYFGPVKRLNRQGPPLLADLPTVEPTEGFVLSDVLKSGATIIDARSADEFRYAHVPGSLSVPLAGRFSTRVGAFVRYDLPVYLVVETSWAERAICELRAIGVDQIAGYFPSREIGDYAESLDALEPAEIPGEALILDVRGASESRERQIPGAVLMPLPVLADRAGELPRDRLIVTVCASGERSQVAASYLLLRGFGKVATLPGGLDAWEAAGLPLARSQPLSASAGENQAV